MEREEEQEEVAEESCSQLNISKSHADENYRFAGSRMEEAPEMIRIEDFQELINEKSEEALKAVDEMLQLPYETAPFQRVVINAVGKGKNVVLVVPCGYGKLDCALKGALVKRITEEEPRGVTLLVQPLTGLQKEVALKANAAVLSMAQELTVMGENEFGEKAELSCSLEDLLAGKYSVLIAHPESFVTALGQQLLAELQARNLILMVVLDEFHQGCEGHWMSFRPEMLRISCGLRVFARKNAPVIAMTATAEQKDVKKLVDMLGLRSKPVVIVASPVQDYHKFSVLQRPSNCYGLLGKIDKHGNWRDSTSASS